MFDVKRIIRIVKIITSFSLGVQNCSRSLTGHPTFEVDNGLDPQLLGGDAN